MLDSTSPVQQTNTEVQQTSVSQTTRLGKSNDQRMPGIQTHLPAGGEDSALALLAVRRSLAHTFHASSRLSHELKTLL